MREFTELMSLAQQGDQDAVRELLLLESPRLETFIEKKLGTKHQASVGVDDVLQESFIAICQGLSKAQIEDAKSFTNWCYRVAENRMLDCIRRESRKKRGGDLRRQVDAASTNRAGIDLLPTDETRASMKAVRRENAEAVHEALKELPTAQRDATRLKYLEGRNNRSIALLLKKSTQAVDGLLKRAKARLAEMLAKVSKN